MTDDRAEILRVADLTKLVSNEIRARIVMELGQGERHAAQLRAIVDGVTLDVTYAHVARLRRGGIVRSRSEVEGTVGNLIWLSLTEKGHSLRRAIEGLADPSRAKGGRRGEGPIPSAERCAE